MPPPTAEDLFTETFRRFTNNWTIIGSFRQVAEAGLPYAEQVLAVQHSVFVETFAQDTEYKNIFIPLDDSGKHMSSEAKKLIQTGMTTEAMTNARTAIDAASIIFVQSILDDCAWSYCKVSALANPKDWERHVDAKQVPLQTVREKEYDSILRELIDARIAKLEHESLLDKIDMLFRVCPPPKNTGIVNKYSYDRNTIQRIDDVRHRIIHSSGFAEPITNAAEDIEYFCNTALFLMAIVNRKYNLRIDPTKFFNIPLPANLAPRNNP